MSELPKLDMRNLSPEMKEAQEEAARRVADIPIYDDGIPWDPYYSLRPQTLPVKERPPWVEEWKAKRKTRLAAPQPPPPTAAGLAARQERWDKARQRRFKAWLKADKAKHR